MTTSPIDQESEFYAYSKGGQAVRFYEHNELACPGCSGNNLHHEHVDVYSRHEDDKEGVHASVGIGSAWPDCDGVGDVRVGRDLTGNPSSRRGGIRIRFRCENCQNTPVLMIAQHKGTTYMEWERP